MGKEKKRGGRRRQPFWREKKRNKKKRKTKNKTRDVVLCGLYRDGRTRRRQPFFLEDRLVFIATRRARLELSARLHIVPEERASERERETGARAGRSLPYKKLLKAQDAAVERGRERKRETQKY